jgi:hypothetical protein
MEPEEGPPVWARGPVSTNQCPRSIVSAESRAWLEMYAAWRHCPTPLTEMNARDAEAMMTIAELVEREADDA